MFKQIRPAIATLAFMTLLTGVAYPLAVTGVAQVAFPQQANGSLVHDTNGQVLGSSLLAQKFEGPEWFWSRPSAGDFATVSSAASNLAPSNPALVARIAKDSQQLAGAGDMPIPLDLVTTSGSGLDPHLSPLAARWQIERIAAARHIPLENLERLIEQHVERPLVGPAVVNVLALNLALAENSLHIRPEKSL